MKTRITWLKINMMLNKIDATNRKCKSVTNRKCQPEMRKTDEFEKIFKILEFHTIDQLDIFYKKLGKSKNGLVTKTKSEKRVT
jgi:hypothetical protein